jgi:hypothetical protein
MKIILATYTHPDFFPPVYEFYAVLKKNGFEPVIVCGESDATESLSVSYNIISVKNTFGKGILGKIKYRNSFERSIVNNVSDARFVVSFCEVTYLLIQNIQKKFEFNHVHHSLEMYRTTFSDFKRSPLSTWRRMRYLSKIKNCEFVSTPSYERSGWLSGVANLKKPAVTILNCQYIDDENLAFVKSKSFQVNNGLCFVHTGGVNDTRSVFEVVEAFHLANIPNSNLVITNIRNNDYCNNIKNYVESHSLKNVKLLGPVSREELVQIQKDADVGICVMKESSLLETKMLAPNKIGEYLKYGMAVIASDAPYYDMFTDCFQIVESVQNKEQLVKAFQNCSGQKKNSLWNILEWYNMEHQMRHLLKYINKNK